MFPSVPVRARQSYRHEALLWRGRDEFVAGLGPFLRDGIEAGEPVMVAVVPEHASWLWEELGADVSRVHFVDMAELGRNPARIIPAWLEFLSRHSGDGRPVRGVGEPIWAGRRPEEVLECQLHEALLNLAVDPKIPFWLVCPYDDEHLEKSIIAEAHRSHPAIATAYSYQGSTAYGGQAHAEALFTAELPPVPAHAAKLTTQDPDAASDSSPGTQRPRASGPTRSSTWRASLVDWSLGACSAALRAQMSGSGTEATR